MKKLLMILPLVILLCFTFSCQKQGEEVAEATKESIEIKTGYAAVNETKLYYEIAGSGDPIVFIHGNGGDRRHWDDQFDVFAKSYKAVRYDVRGFGKSAMPVVGESYRHVDDLNALMEYLNISRANICGLSMGCGIAVDFVLAYPEMSKSLIAVGPWVVGYQSPVADDMFKVFGEVEVSAVVKESGPKAAGEAWLNTSVFKNSIRDPGVFARMTEIGHDYSFWHYINPDPGRSLTPPAIQQIDKLRLPTLIVTAEYDLEACREIADLLEQTVPNSKKVQIAGAGHVMNLEKPDEFNKAVLGFLSGLK